MNVALQRALRCWGKTGQTDAEFHPAMFHMIDVGHVAQILLSPSAPLRYRTVIAQTFGAQVASLASWVPWLIALHDIGKVTAAFQSKSSGQLVRLQQEGFHFAGWAASNDKPHSIFSQVFVEDLLVQLTPSISRSARRAVAEMIGGHHGSYQRPDEVQEARTILEVFEPPDWGTLRHAAEAALRDHFLSFDIATLPKPPNVSTATLALSGFTILCDWIGSDSRFFPPAMDTSLERYMLQSKQQAHNALALSGLLTPTDSAAPVIFSALFSDVPEPRPLQFAVDAIPEHLLAQPCLVIIEAPTGEGKTEAALALAHRISQAHGGEEFYYALPTMATSNQMFGRLQKHLQSRLGVAMEVKLVHGQSFLVEDELRVEPLRNGNVQEPGDSRSASIEWFSSRKRALLAPFGVGTIDQAELAALNTRHAALRMFGLTGKVLIVDEVHAYDTYMTTIIEQMVRWLSALDTSVILLSATLPLARRAQLAKAYGKELAAYVTGDDYPNLMVLSRSGCYQSSPGAWQPSRRLSLGTLTMNDEQAEQKAAWLLDLIGEGGCACWMTNTVKRAQQLFKALQKRAPAAVHLSLLHAQYPLEDRQRWEVEVADKYGPQGKRPEQGIVIGTQVLEQSLDLDFDVMVSDLAPIDLMLQRAGRLHRHKRTRPEAHTRPKLWINLHDDAQPMAPPKADQRMYTEYILRRSWGAIEGREEICLPQEYRPLIEAVYDVAEHAQDSPLRAAWDKLVKQENHASQEARIRLLPPPDAGTPFSYATTQTTFEENENSAAWIVAQTRLGEESLNVIPLEVDAGYGVLPDGTRVSLRAETDIKTQFKLLRRNLRVSQYDAIQAIQSMNEPPTPLFKQSPLLKNYYLLPLTAGSAISTYGNVRLTFLLHPRLGLVIEREKK